MSNSLFSENTIRCCSNTKLQSLNHLRALLMSWLIMLCSHQTWIILVISSTLTNHNTVCRSFKLSLKLFNGLSAQVAVNSHSISMYWLRRLKRLCRHWLWCWLVISHGQIPIRRTAYVLIFLRIANLTWASCWREPLVRKDVNSPLWNAQVIELANCSGQMCTCIQALRRDFTIWTVSMLNANRSLIDWELSSIPCSIPIMNKLTTLCGCWG